MPAVIEDENRRECLIVCAFRDPAPHCEVVDERAHLGLAHLVRASFPLEEDEASSPLDRGFFGTPAVVLCADRDSDTILIRRLRRGCLVTRTVTACSGSIS
jgi:hypothetical protein